MNSKTYQAILQSEIDSENFANKLATILKAPLILGFSGDIGMGKTTIIRFLFKKIGVTDRIKSPTYSIVESYKHKNINLHHFDLYRIQDESELDYIGFRDYFADNTICCIEWPENLGRFALDLDINLKLSRHGDGRLISLCAQSIRGISVLKKYLSSLM